MIGFLAMIGAACGIASVLLIYFDIVPRLEVIKEELDSISELGE